MRLRLSVLFLLIGFSGLFAQSDHLPGEMIVLLRPGVSPQALQRDFALQRDPLVLRYERLLSARMNIHLLRVEGDAAAEEKALSRIARHPQVILAQFNHRIETRETHQQPNDPGFAQQWALNNTGQTGGLADADVDAPEAWNITTGGVSSLGDTIVVAVIDEGIDIQHEDLDLWKNHAEIPGNGLDDDANGYTDDYQGWNAYSGNGSIPASYHGTHVAGIVAAIGNNGIGVSGINWHTKVMNIAGSSGNEAVVISAYGYVLEMRKRYNESDGLEGAFVVATNASFGVNYGNPLNYPIWCAIYDSLGAAGVLNVSATMNINANVDVSGDVPSTCASPYLLTVTNTTASDQKNGGAAYGLLSIDIGAPGTSIRSTLPGNTYGFETGTSMAAPLVAGTAALLVSAACPALMVRYRSDPAGTVLLLKQLIMNGSDPVPGLQGQVVSGRLNAYQSLLLLQDSCALIPANCLPPYQLQAYQLSDSSATLRWTQLGNVGDFQLRYRAQGSNIWTLVTGISDTSYVLQGLSACTFYEFQAEAVCGSSSSGYFGLKVFRTEGCCEAPGTPVLSNLSDSSVSVSWNAIYGAVGYELQYRNSPASAWSSVALSDTFYQLNSLLPCTTYEVRVAALCASVQNGYSDIRDFRTPGCGACLDASYCEARGQNTQFEWIQGVELGPLSHFSGPNGGYANFTLPSAQLTPGQSYDFELTPGYNGFAFQESWRIWIDLDQDGIFNDSTEKVFDPGPALGTLQGSISIPATALPGATRMRVAMRFPGFGGSNRPEACGVFNEGEVEDYCLTFASDTILCPAPELLEIETFTSSDSISLSWQGTGPAYRLRLRKLGGIWQEYTGVSSPWKLGGLDPCANYEVAVSAVCQTVGSAWSETLEFVSPGCGACRDRVYCNSSGSSGAQEWIARVSLGGESYSTGADNGYGEFTLFSFQAARNSTPQLRLVSGFAAQGYDEYWRVWADWNQDGAFSEGSERLLDTLVVAGDTLGAAIEVPEDALLGNTRLRVSMRRGIAADACEVFTFGEVEDYCLEVLKGVGISPEPESGLRIYPQPAAELLKIESPQVMRSLTLLDMQGKILWQLSDCRTHTFDLPVGKLPAGLYLLQVKYAEGGEVRKVLVGIK